MAGRTGSYPVRFGEARGIVLGEHNTVYQQFVTGIDRLPTRYDGRIDNFVTGYLGRPDRPEPFGGREPDLTRLDDWLADDTADPYLLLCATGGRGKSALLVHWSQRLFAREHTDVVLVPVSIRYRTNLPTVFFPALAARLAEVHGEEPPPAADGPPEVWEDIVAAYLARRPPQERLVVVLDGLDEAADWELGPHVLPSDPPAGLRIVVSARTTAERPDGADWLRALGWQSGGLGRVQRLGGIPRDGIRDIVAGLPAHPEHPPEPDALADALHRLTDGDPLLLGEHLKDLMDGSGRLVRSAESFDTLPAGLDGVFQHWWQDQRKLWQVRYGALALHAVEAQVNALMAVFSQALGPLRREDLARVDPELVGATAETALAALGRFLVSEGVEHGHVLSHPRLAEYWAAHHMTDAQCSHVQARFTAWGQDVTRALNEGALPPADAPPYAVQYLAAHLHRTRAPVTDRLPLLGSGRQRAWMAVEGTYAGFLADVHVCREALRRADAEALAEGADLVRLPDDVLCTLIDVSIGDETRGISPVLLGALVRHRLWTPVQALVYARRMDRPTQPAALLAVAAEQSGPARRDTAVEALTSAAEKGTMCLADTVPRAALLGATGEAAEHADRVLGQSLVRGFEQPAHARLIPFLTAEQRESRLSPAVVLTEAAVAATTNDSDLVTACWAATVAALTPSLDEDEQRTARAVLRELLPGVTPHHLPTVAEVVPRSLLPELVDLARNSENGAVVVNALGAVADRLPPALRDAVVTEAVSVALEGNRRAGVWLPWGPRASALEELTAVLPAELHPRVLDLVESAPDDMNRGYCLLSVLPHLTGNAHTAGVEAAETLVPALPRAVALTVAAINAAPDQAPGLARRALGIARDSEDRGTWATVLWHVASLLDDEELVALGEEALREPEGPDTVHALAGVGAALWTRGRRAEVLRWTSGLTDGHDRLVVLLTLGADAAGENQEDQEDQETLVRDLVTTADGLADPGLALTLAKYEGILDERHAHALLERVLAVTHPRLRSVCLRVVLGKLSGPLPDDVRDAALDCAVAEGGAGLFAVPARLGHAEEALTASRLARLPRAAYEEAVTAIAPFLHAPDLTTAFRDVAERAEEDAREWEQQWEELRRARGDESRTSRIGLEGEPVPGAGVLRALSRRSAEVGHTRCVQEIVDSYGYTWPPAAWLMWIRDVAPFLPEAHQRYWAAHVPGLTARLDGADTLLAETLGALPADVLRSLHDLLLEAPADRPRLPVLAVLAPLLPEPSRTEALDEVWRLARAERDSGVRARALLAMAEHLPAERRREACAELLDRVAAEDVVPESPQGTGIRIAPLAPHLTRTQVDRFLEDEWSAALDGADLVALLLRFAHFAGARETLARAESLERKGAMTREDVQELLVRVADSRPADECRSCLERALTGARTVGDGTAVLRTLTHLAGAAPATERAALVERCLRMYGELTAHAVPRELGTVLGALLPLLDRAAEQELLDALPGTFGGDLLASGAGRRVVGALASAGHGERALRLAATAPPGVTWDDATVAALAALPEPLLEQALDMADSLARTDAEGLAIPLLCGLATRFSGERREQLVAHALDMAERSAEFPYNLRETLGLLPPLSPDAARRVEELAARENRPERGTVLACLARSMTEEQLLDAVTEIGLLPSHRSLLAPRALEVILPELCRHGHAARAVEAFADWAGRGKNVSRLVRALAPVAPPDSIPALAEPLQRPPHDSWDRWHALGRLALHAPRSALPPLSEKLTSTGSKGRGQLLAALARRAEGTRAEELARRAVDETRGHLGGHTSSGDAEHALTALGEVTDLMTPRSVADTLLMTAARCSSGTANTPWARPLLGKLAAAVTGMSRRQQDEAVRHVLDGASGMSRRDVLRALEALAPALTALGGDRSLPRVFDAVTEVRHRWP